jgi:O-acetyl-ADP-ribose deacetylase (regulator of RNase III)
MRDDRPLPDRRGPDHRRLRPAGEARDPCRRPGLARRLAKQAGLASIAFPAISTGIFGYPVDQATGVAVETVRAWLAEKDSLERVVFCVFGDEVEQAYRQALGPPGSLGR